MTLDSFWNDHEKQNSLLFSIYPRGVMGGFVHGSCTLNGIYHWVNCSVNVESCQENYYKPVFQCF